VVPIPAGQTLMARVKKCSLGQRSDHSVSSGDGPVAVGADTRVPSRFQYLTTSEKGARSCLSLTAEMPDAM